MAIKKSTWAGFKAAIGKEFDENPKIVFIGIIGVILSVAVSYAVFFGNFSANVEYDDFKAGITTQAKQ